MTVTVVVARMVLNLDQERGAWVIYSNLHILAVAVDDTPQQRMRRAELWQEAETRIVARVHERDRDRFDTSGFSCRGIVPRSPAAEF